MSLISSVRRIYVTSRLHAEKNGKFQTQRPIPQSNKGSIPKPEPPSSQKTKPLASCRPSRSRDGKRDLQLKKALRKSWVYQSGVYIATTEIVCAKAPPATLKLHLRLFQEGSGCSGLRVVRGVLVVIKSGSSGLL